MKHWTSSLVKMDACPDAVEWARGYASIDAAWAACERADWLLWYLSQDVEQNSPEHRRLVACAIECGRTSLPYAGRWRDELSAVYDTLEAWTRGEIVDLMAAALAVAAAAATAAAYTTAAVAAAYTTAAVANSAVAAAVAAAVANSAAARATAHKTMCAIVRKHYLTPPSLEEAKP